MSSSTGSLPQRDVLPLLADVEKIELDLADLLGVYFPKQIMGQQESKPGDLLQGTLDMLILKTLSRGAMHGYAITEFIQETTDDVLKVEEGALYPALHRLELRGLLTSEWGLSDNNRRAKFYKLTAAGRKQLAAETEHWGRMAGAIARILQTA